MNSNGRAPTTVDDVARADEAVEPQVGRVEQRAQRRHDRHVVAHAGEVRGRPRPWRASASARWTAPSSRSRSRRRRPRGPGSASRSAARRAASRPCGCRRPRPSPRAGSARARHAHHVAEAGEDHARLAGDRDAVVDPAHRDHADRAAGPVDQLDVRRAAGRRPRTCRSSACARRRPPSPCSGGPARRRRGSRRPARGRARGRGTRRRTSCAPAPPSRRSPGVRRAARRRAPPASTSAISTVLFDAVLGRAQREPARAVDAARTSIGMPSSQQVMQWSRAVAGSSVHSITLAFSSSSSCS